jgi:hypothetical protein
MIYDVVNGSTERPSVEARESGRNADQDRRRRLAPIRCMAETKMLQEIKVCLAYNVMGFIDQHKFVSRGVKLVQAFPRSDALYGGDCDISCA